MDPLPDNNPKTVFGRAKPPLHAIPPVALLHLGLGMENGETKYGLFNWRERKVSSSVYYDAALRHLLSWWDGEETARDSGVHHLGHVMACMAILLDAQEQGNLNDDRGPTGVVADVIERMRAARVAAQTPPVPKPPVEVQLELFEDLPVQRAPEREDAPQVDPGNNGGDP